MEKNLSQAWRSVSTSTKMPTASPTAQPSKQTPPMQTATTSSIILPQLNMLLLSMQVISAVLTHLMAITAVRGAIQLIMTAAIMVSILCKRKASVQQPLICAQTTVPLLAKPMSAMMLVMAHPIILAITAKQIPTLTSPSTSASTKSKSATSFTLMRMPMALSLKTFPLVKLA